MKRASLLLSVVLAVTCSLPVSAATRYVSASSSSPSSPYTNWATAAQRIEDTLVVAGAGDLIWVTNGTYTSTGAMANASMLNITNSISLKSVNGAGATIIDGAALARCIYLNNASAVVEGFTIRNGNATGGAPANRGGGAYISVNGTVRNCLIISNSAAGDGGGVYVATDGTVASCTIATNIATGNGGGVCVGTNGTVQNSILYFNAAAANANWQTNLTAAITYTCASPLPPGAGNTASDPLLLNLGGGDFHIASNSPCLNTGIFQTWMTGAFDLDGQPRVMGQVDIGVDEETRLFYVAKHGTNTNAGTQANPWGTIQYAVTNSAILAGDTIQVGEGTYTESVTFPSGGKNGLTLKGGFNTNDWSWAPSAHPTVIKPATNTSDVLSLSSFNHTFMGLTLTGGRYGALGNANADSRYTFSHCVISNNTQSGLYWAQTAVDLLARNCLIAKNGVYGIYWYQDGGSSYIKEIYNCTIVDNGDAGIYDAYQYGRTIYVYNTIVANNAYGIRRQGGPAMNLANSSIYSNRIENFLGVSGQDGLAITFQSPNMSAFPKFVGGGDYHLQSGSICVGYGQDLRASGVVDDLDINPRPGVPDIGCYQSSYSAPTRYATSYADSTKPDDTGDGSTPATAKQTIGSAIASTTPGGTCMVGAGAYHEEIFVPGGMMVSGTNRALTSVSSAWHVASMLETGSTLQGLTLYGGIRGADIANDNNTVQNCVLRGNTYGLVQNRPNTKVFECVLTNNTTYGIWGNGITGAGGVGMTVRNALIARNGNSGVYLGWDNGGANWSQWWNCTVVSNGLHGYEANTYNSQAYMTNTIFAQNAGYGTYVSTWGSAKQYLNYCCEYGNVSGANFANNGQTPQIGANMVNSDPMLDSAYHLLYGSPCVDAGINIASFTNDLDGTARTNTFDIGAYESPFAPPPKYDFAYADASMLDDTGAGTNWLTAKKTVGAALSILTPSGTVYMASGLYNEAVSIPANITVSGTNWTSTIISNSGNVVTMGATNAVLRELTALGGTYGVAVPGNRNFIKHCVLRNNTSSGVYLTGYSNQVIDCVLRNNQYGLWCQSVRTPYTVDRCTVASNTSHGIYQTGGNPTSPGGLIMDSLIIRNGADGVRSETDNGGDSTYLYNCTIADNTGNGFYDNYLTVTPYIRNSIISGNGLYGIRQADNNHYNIYILNSCLFSNALGNMFANVTWDKISPQTGNFTANPQVNGNGDYHLQGISPCIGYGTTNGILGLATNDLDGIARTVPFDMGCYESASNPAPRSVVQYVNGAAGNDAADGLSWATPKKTIGSGLAFTTNGTCYVAAGTYFDTVFVPPQVALQGADRQSTIITGAWHLVYMADTNAAVRKLALKYGHAGVLAAGNNSTIEECDLIGNTWGVYISGVWQSGYQSFVNRCLAASNSIHGCYVVQSGVRLRNSALVRNGWDGLRINANNPGKNQYIDFCTIANNASNGVNDTDDVYNYPSYFTNCIISSNGLYGVLRQAAPQQDATYAYCLVYGNTLGDTNGSRIVYTAGMITNQLPQLGTKYGPYQLNLTSPCVDSGVDIGVTNDLVGALRPTTGRKPLVGSGFDIGAFEFVPPPKGSILIVR